MCFFTREKQFKQVKGYKLSPVLISALFRGGGITTYFNNTLVGWEKSRKRAPEKFYERLDKYNAKM